MPVSVEEILHDYHRAKRELEKERRRDNDVCEPAMNCGEREVVVGKIIGEW